MAHIMISEEEVKKISKLCRLRIEEDKIHYMSQQLSNIMEMIDQLQQVDTKDAIPLTSVCDMKLRMRADKVTEHDLREELFKNVPGSRADFAREIKCFVVPKVIE
jgi:aspartyl-tRNA(Asn)/glutamyl-tRNA(Gln) amidotransferase subunit C